ncbi:MAG: HRDC domain-containing protein [Betaproteobacteria bacterium]|nr:HRDC domain-containing protein [Betaproteobacteria bacterium]
MAWAGGAARLLPGPIAWIEGRAPVQGQPGGKRERIDYREVLNEQDFAVFADLRRLRKGLAEQDGVPAYALFTNEQLVALRARLQDERTLRLAPARRHLDAAGVSVASVRGRG